MPAKISHAELRKRLGDAALTGEWELFACSRCGRQSLIDHETLRIYPDPRDLAHSMLNIEENYLPCSGCGAADWDFAPVENPAPEWRWAIDTSASSSSEP